MSIGNEYFRFKRWTRLGNKDFLGGNTKLSIGNEATPAALPPLHCATKLKKKLKQNGTIVQEQDFLSKAKNNPHPPA